jgi:hypothetical protein
MAFTFQEQLDEQDPECVANFDRQFEHTDWIDGESVVQAETDDGFNVRFHKIMDDFDALAADARQGLECTAALRTSLFKVIGEAQAELARLGTPAPTLTLTPALVALSDPWAHATGGAETPAGADAADGMMPLVLPDGATLGKFRVLGRKPGGNLSVSLVRQALDANSQPDEFVTITPPDSNNGFDRSANVPAGKAAVKNESFRYYVHAQVDGATGVTVQLTCFQITTA